MSVVYCYCLDRHVDTDKEPETCKAGSHDGCQFYPKPVPCWQCGGKGGGCSACTDDDGLPL